MKTFLLNATDQKLMDIVATFLHKKSLYSLRSELRGRMGLPRMRQNDSAAPSEHDVSFDSALNRIYSISPIDKKLTLPKEGTFGGGTTLRPASNLGVISPAKSALSRGYNTITNCTATLNFNQS